MNELIIVDYHDALRAERVLTALREHHPEWGDELADALVFVQRADRKTLNTANWQEQMGLSDHFLRQLKRLIRPGDEGGIRRLARGTGHPPQVRPGRA